MRAPSEPFMELLLGKTPEAIYDSLHAGRYLSTDALTSPVLVLEDIKTLMLSHRQRPLAPPKKMEWVAEMLADSGYLNESGLQLLRGDEC